MYRDGGGDTEFGVSRCGSGGFGGHISTHFGTDVTDVDCTSFDLFRHICLLELRGRRGNVFGSGGYGVGGPVSLDPDVRDHGVPKRTALQIEPHVVGVGIDVSFVSGTFFRTKPPRSAGMSGCCDVCATSAWTEPGIAASEGACPACEVGSVTSSVCNASNLVRFIFDNDPLAPDVFSSEMRSARVFCPMRLSFYDGTFIFLLEHDVFL